MVTGFLPVLDGLDEFGGVNALGDSSNEAMKLLDDLIALGEELRTALLRNVTKGLRPEG